MKFILFQTNALAKYIYTDKRTQDDGDYCRAGNAFDPAPYDVCIYNICADARVGSVSDGSRAREGCEEKSVAVQRKLYYHQTRCIYRSLYKYRCI